MSIPGVRPGPVPEGFVPGTLRSGPRQGETAAKARSYSDGTIIFIVQPDITILPLLPESYIPIPPQYPPGAPLTPLDLSSLPQLFQPPKPRLIPPPRNP